MNCKPGDLAIFVNEPNGGRMVRVIGDSPLQAEVEAIHPHVGHCWQCEALTTVVCYPGGWSDRMPVVMPPGSIVQCCPDRDLRPLRGDDDSAATERGLYQPKPQREFA